MTAPISQLQYRTLSFIAECPGGHTDLLPLHWRDRHHQVLIKRGLIRLRSDPFKSKAMLLRGWITARGRQLVEAAPPSLRARAKAAEDRDYERYVAELEAGGAE